MKKNRNKKLVWIPYSFHKKIKRKAVENDSSIESELEIIIEKELGPAGD